MWRGNIETAKSNSITADFIHGNDRRRRGASAPLSLSLVVLNKSCKRCLTRLFARCFQSDARSFCSVTGVNACVITSPHPADQPLTPDS